MSSDQRIVAAADPQSGHNPEWQRLWLGVRARQWKTLAVVPGGRGGPPSFSLDVALTLTRAGMLHLRLPIHVADANQLRFGALTPFLEEVENCTRDGGLVLVALPPVEDSPIVTPIARAVDSALLCVVFDRMLLSDSKKTIDAIGAANFVGTAVFRADERGNARLVV